MKIILSPSKTFKNLNQNDFKYKNNQKNIFIKETETLIHNLQKLSQLEIKNLLKVSDNLTNLNYNRYQNWQDLTTNTALDYYDGDVYRGLNAEGFSPADLNNCNKKLYIISGLYGLLRHNDRIKPYRLDMSTKLKSNDAKNLYDFWGSKIAKELSKDHETVLVCASNEYSKAVLPHLKAPYLIPRFFQEINGSLKEKGLFAKYLRGNLANWVIKNKIDDPKKLENYNNLGVQFLNYGKNEIHFLLSEDFSLKGKM